MEKLPLGKLKERGVRGLPGIEVARTGAAVMLSGGVIAENRREGSLGTPWPLAGESNDTVDGMSGDPRESFDFTRGPSSAATCGSFATHIWGETQPPAPVLFPIGLLESARVLCPQPIVLCW